MRRIALTGFAVAAFAAAGCPHTTTIIECVKGKEKSMPVSKYSSRVFKDGCKIRIEHKGRITTPMAEDARKLLEATIGAPPKEDTD